MSIPPDGVPLLRKWDGRRRYIVAQIAANEERTEMDGFDLPTQLRDLGVPPHHSISIIWEPYGDATFAGALKADVTDYLGGGIVVFADGTAAFEDHGGGRRIYDSLAELLADAAMQSNG